MPSIPFDRYLPFADLTELLLRLADQHPDLVSVESIGQSYEGREIWLVTVTDRRTGPASEKPAFWCDGNIHASEVSASSAVLAVIDRLVSGPDPILATHAFYLVPRLNPDGAEWALETPPRIVRSGTRPYPFEDEDPEGLEPSDLDGDGRILQMRVADPNGAWVVSDADTRLMRRREPGETGGVYYRLMSEGLFHAFDGIRMRGRRRKEGLDFNRNFPSAWRPEHEQFGAGPYPTSELEIRAAVDAISKRPNICGAVTFHTFSGVHLRPPSRMPDDDLPAEDIWAYKKIGDKGEEMTGYPAISNYHEFRYHPKEVITGVFDDWMYEHRGVFAWTTEIWSPQREAGITDYKYIDWFREHPAEHDLALLRWSDDKLGGRGYLTWKEFDHPQLGRVEIGGWDFMLAWRNPPIEFLEREVRPLADWVRWQAACAPCLSIRKSEVEKVGDAWRLRLVVQNVGWLPTNVTKVALDRKLCRGVIAEITPDPAPAPAKPPVRPDWLVTGDARIMGGQLTGWSHIDAASHIFGGMQATDDLAVFEWVVNRPGSYSVRAWHDRAGTVRATMVAE